MSLLLANGHQEAYHYPLGRVFDEANLIIERENARQSMEAVLAQYANAAIHSKKAGPAFTKLINKLSFVTEPIKGLLERKD